jgi:hypothetical protein
LKIAPPATAEISPLKVNPENSHCQGDFFFHCFNEFFIGGNHWDFLRFRQNQVTGVISGKVGLQAVLNQFGIDHPPGPAGSAGATCSPKASTS